MRTRLILLPAILILLFGSAPARAGWMNELARSSGLGWSDGYHAYDGCAGRSRKSQPWSGRSRRNISSDEHLHPYLAEPSQPVPTPAPPPLEDLPPAKASRQSPQLHISRPNY